jgi:uncharacterized membrane protein
MKCFKEYYPFFGLCCLVIIFMFSCTHDPFDLDTTNPDPIDTTTMPVDTSQSTMPCDPDTVYFENDILPILISNCTKSGCHDAATAEEGVILTNYNDIINTGKVEAYDLNDSELYEVLVENDPDKQMPPPGEVQLSSEAINLIATWINQGAKNSSCSENAGACNTTNVSFAADINPLLMTTCLSCHSGTNPSGGVSLNGYNDISQVALNGRLYGAVSWQAGFVRMPFGGQQLNDCFIDKLNAWINDGAKDN